MKSLRALYLVVGFLLAVNLGFVIGTLGVLPMTVVPRGSREQYTITAAQLWAWLVARVLMLIRLRVTGQVRLPGHGGALFVSNHRSWVDPLLLIAYTGSLGIAKASVFWYPIIGFYGWLAGVVYVDRSSFRGRKRARAEAMWLLHQGARLHVFPEGTRTRTGELLDKVYLTLPKDCWDDNLPVVPCAVWGTERVLPPDELQAYPFVRCRLDIGKPLFPKDYPDRNAFAKAVWDDVRLRVARLRAEEEPAARTQLPQAVL